MFTNVGNAPAKLLKDFVKKDDVLPCLKAAYVEETVYVGADQLDALASIKSKNELIADVVALLQSPAKNVVSALTSGAKASRHPRNPLKKRKLTTNYQPDTNKKIILQWQI